MIFNWGSLFLKLHLIVTLICFDGKTCQQARNFWCHLSNRDETADFIKKQKKSSYDMLRLHKKIVQTNIFRDIYLPISIYDRKNQIQI